MVSIPRCPYNIIFSHAKINAFGSSISCYWLLEPEVPFAISIYPTYPDIDQSNFSMDFNESAVKAIPHNAPKPRCREMDLCIFIDINHVGSKIARRSRTGFMIYMNMSLVSWCLKKLSA